MPIYYRTFLIIGPCCWTQYLTEPYPIIPKGFGGGGGRSPTVFHALSEPDRRVFFHARPRAWLAVVLVNSAQTATAFYHHSPGMDILIILSQPTYYRPGWAGTGVGLNNHYCLGRQATPWRRQAWVEFAGILDRRNVNSNSYSVFDMAAVFL